MKNTTGYGIALILSSISFVITMLFHPTGADMLPTNENAMHEIQVTIFTHSLAIFCIPIAFWGFWGFSRVLGLKRIGVQWALILYAFGEIAIMCAGVFSGFGGSSLAKRMLKTDDESARILLKTLYQYNLSMNQGFDKVMVVSILVAVIIWSLCMWEKNGLGKVISVLGCVIGVSGLAAFWLGFINLYIFGFGLIVFALSLWTILVAIWMFTLKDEIEA